MFYTLLNYLSSQSISLPTQIVDKKEEKEEEKEEKKETNNNGTFVWSTHGTNTVYTDIESGLIKYDFYDVLVKGM